MKEGDHFRTSHESTDSLSTLKGGGGFLGFISQKIVKEEPFYPTHQKNPMYNNLQWCTHRIRGLNQPGWASPGSAPGVCTCVCIWNIYQFVIHLENHPALFPYKWIICGPQDHYWLLPGWALVQQKIGVFLDTLYLTGIYTAKKGLSLSFFNFGSPIWRNLDNKHAQSVKGSTHNLESWS